jgi:hypothetical protein
MCNGCKSEIETTNEGFEIIHHAIVCGELEEKCDYCEKMYKRKVINEHRRSCSKLNKQIPYNTEVPLNESSEFFDVVLKKVEDKNKGYIVNCR